ncbi:hypothetical protein P3T76_005221 [Phytophthora citrophthora]|uniref:Uncharacterized protein n=1 Tax=Phytophthora citrophthora TaxID=4793 RepID=A0AAD9GS91_9STRA|nr:hypothetical protein P3T76_005221 [Phytophthora citrophthora]
MNDGYHSGFLVAMNHRPMATQTLKELLTSYVNKSYSAEQYAKAAEVLALQLLLVDEGIDAARKIVSADPVLEDVVKLIQAAHLAANDTKKVGQASVDHETPQQPGGTASGTTSSGARVYDMEQDDTSNFYVLIGGTATALAVAAAGALSHRNKIYEAISNTIPVISKSFTDAKYALFEA